MDANRQQLINLLTEAEQLRLRNEELERQIIINLNFILKLQQDNENLTWQVEYLEDQIRLRQKFESIILGKE